MSADNEIATVHSLVGAARIPEAWYHEDPQTCPHCNPHVCPECAGFTKDEEAALKTYFALLEAKQVQP